MRIVVAPRPFSETRSILASGEVFAARDIILVVRLTRHWIHYGFLAHTLVCVVIAAVEGMLGR